MVVLLVQSSQSSNTNMDTEYYLLMYYGKTEWYPHPSIEDVKVKSKRHTVVLGLFSTPELAKQHFLKHQQFPFWLSASWQERHQEGEPYRAIKRLNANPDSATYIIKGVYLDDPLASSLSLV